MFKLTRTLILMVVTVLVSQPVMACCLTSHGGPAAVETMSEAPPCHGDNANSEKHGEQPSQTDCQGCFDCDAAVLQAQSMDDGVLLTQQSLEISLAIIAAKFSGFEHQSIVLKTGSPGDPPLEKPTPVSLKQRLLI